LGDGGSSGGQGKRLIGFIVGDTLTRMKEKNRTQAQSFVIDGALVHLTVSLNPTASLTNYKLEVRNCWAQYADFKFLNSITSSGHAFVFGSGPTRDVNWDAEICRVDSEDCTECRVDPHPVSKLRVTIKDVRRRYDTDRRWRDYPWTKHLTFS
jgi:hypothetical protein